MEANSRHQTTQKWIQRLQWLKQKEPQDNPEKPRTN
jgi:hypothetical protein